MNCRVKPDDESEVAVPLKLGYKGIKKWLKEEGIFRYIFSNAFLSFKFICDF